MLSYHDYYDKIYSTKDYAGEVATVLRLFNLVCRGPFQRVLDVGCGTGGHARAMAAAGMNVVGADTDALSIAIAQKRSASISPKPQFVAGPATAISERRFDAAVSLFNVVNYIMDVGSLKEFLQSIREKLLPGAPFVFDCWNGIAAVRDLPGEKRSEILLDDEKITVSTAAETDLMSQTVALTTRIQVAAVDLVRELPPHHYRHRLWMPQDLKDILATVGFEVRSISSWAHPDVPATADTWKILFVCVRGA